MLKDLAMPGETIQILVKMQHNTVSGRNNSYSGNRNFFFIEHEFVVITKKPSGYEIAYVLIIGSPPMINTKDKNIYLSSPL